jgi:uncharacterized protein YueI
VLGLQVFRENLSFIVRKENTLESHAGNDCEKSMDKENSHVLQLDVRLEYQVLMELHFVLNVKLLLVCDHF